jgi:hypothetical protein
MVSNLDNIACAQNNSIDMVNDGSIIKSNRVTVLLKLLDIRLDDNSSSSDST